MICRICNKMFKTDKTLIIHYKNIHSDLYNSLLDKNIRVLDYNNKLNLPMSTPKQPISCATKRTIFKILNDTLLKAGPDNIKYFHYNKITYFCGRDIDLFLRHMLLKIM